MVSSLITVLLIIILITVITPRLSKPLIEGLDSSNPVSNEAVQNLTAVYNAGEISVGNIKSTANTNVMGDLSVNGSSTLGGLVIGSPYTGAASDKKSEISNDLDKYKKLMLVGNKAGDGKTRQVGVWDNLTVAGTSSAKDVSASNNVNAKKKLCIDGTCISKEHLEILTGKRKIRMRMDVPSRGKGDSSCTDPRTAYLNTYRISDDDDDCSSDNFGIKGTKSKPGAFFTILQ